MPVIKESQNIPGVLLVSLQPVFDERGRFLETFRREWFPQRSWDCVQSNRSDSSAGVLRGLHFHRHQVDYWYVAAGSIRAGLADLRRTSKSFRNAITIDMSEDDHLGLFIPSGVAHGFAALQDATLVYIVDNYYDGADEYGVAWNDPELDLDWGVPAPILSERDRSNPLLSEIPLVDLPA